MRFLAIGNFFEKKEAPGGVLLKRYSYFAKFIGKHLYQTFFISCRLQALLTGNFIKKETLAQVFTC